jgi:hypothetical protein
MRFLRNQLSVAVVAIVAMLGSACQTGPTTSPTNTNPVSPSLSSGPAPSASPLSPTIPGDANFSDLPNSSTIQQIQHDFDVFSWQSFVALNWPSDQSQIIGSGPDGDNATVWGTYIESYEVFLPQGQTPSWDSRSVPTICQPADPAAGKLPVFRMTTKVSDQVLNFSQLTTKKARLISRT